MDDLSVSVVPKERAGMATGIFTTMRVAGEALTMAITAAVVSAFALSGLHARLPASAGVDMHELANRIASGNLAQLSSNAGLERAALVAIYGDAFHATLLVLAAVTAVGAIVSLTVLRRPQHAATEGMVRTTAATEC